MITVDQFMDVKTRIANKQSLRSIAQDTGHSRNTIRKIARGERVLQDFTEKKPRKPRAHKIDPLCDYIKKQVSEFNLSSERILPEIQAMGYKGGIHSLRRYVASIKAESQRLASATVRFETPPGKQAQCDWGHIGKFLDATGNLIDIYVFVIVLSFSRQMFIHFTTSMKIPTLIECHEKAFEYFEGVPQTILYDNMAQVRSGPNKLNPTFADFSDHFGFNVSTHRPYRPRTKGKVERMVDYIKGNFLNAREFAGLEDLNLQGQKWLDETANVRVHSTTHAKPSELWQQEKELLIALDPARPFIPSLRVERKVSKDSFVATGNSRYSVPPSYIGKSVEVTMQGTSITIRCDGAIIAEHPLAESVGQSVAKEEHLQALWETTLERHPLQGERHCNVRLDETVQSCDLSRFEEACA